MLHDAHTLALVRHGPEQCLLVVEVGVETSLEIVLRGPLDSASGLQQECKALWEQATPFPVPKQPTAAAAAAEPTGITHEVLDPLAAQVLRENPKAFVLGKKKRKPI